MLVSQPAIGASSAPLDEFLREQEGHLHSDPFARMMAAHEEKLEEHPRGDRRSAGTRIGRPSMLRPISFQLGDIRPGFREPPQLLL